MPGRIGHAPEPLAPAAAPALVPRQRAPRHDRVPTPPHRPATARQRSRRALLLPLGLALMLLLATIGAGAAVLVARQEHATHGFVMSGTAGGLTRDRAEEARLADRIATARSGFEAQFRGRLSQFASAVYRVPVGAPGAPAGPVVVLGAAIDTRGDPADFVQGFRDAAVGNGSVVARVSVGPGAQGVCAESRTASPKTSCAWATGDSIGELVPTVTGWRTEDLARLMRAVRTDVELTWR